jgi:hypothetical protein
VLGAGAGDGGGNGGAGVDGGVDVPGRGAKAENSSSVSHLADKCMTERL